MWPFRRKGCSDNAAPADPSAKPPPSLGSQGEKIARACLRRQGMKILAENYRCPVGEADLIALDRATQKESGAETIVFVEVKTRSSDRYTDPEGAVNADKRRRLRKIADYYVSTRSAADFRVRFDIVSIVLRPGQEPQVRHIPNAF